MKRRPQGNLIILFFIKISWGQGFFHIQVTSSRDLKITLLTVLCLSIIWHFIHLENSVWITIVNGNEPFLFLIVKIIVVVTTFWLITKLH
jgi:hypothetical protein